MVEELLIDNRLSTALQLISGTIDDKAVRAVLELYDEKTDSENPNWQNFLALAYDSTNSSFFDDAKAHQLFVKASKLGSAAAAYNLGTRWLHGTYDKIDLSRAEMWFAHAFDLGHGCAGAHVSEMMMTRPEYGKPGGQETTDLAHAILAQSEEQGGPWATYYSATLHASGRLGQIDAEAALTKYYRLTAAHVCGVPRARAHQVLALQFFLGFLAEQNVDRALTMIAAFPREEKQPDIRYGAAHVIDRLRHIITNDILPHQAEQLRLGRNEVTLPPDHQEAHDFLKAVAHGQVDPASALAAVDAGAVRVTQALSDRLWAASTLAGLENDQRQSYWYMMLDAVQFRLLGLTEQQVSASTRDFGPVYNQVTRAGYPIPGTQQPRPDGVAAEAGFGKFVGLRATHAGQIAFSFERLPLGAAALIFPEDIAVVLALAFGDEKGVQWPSVSVEDIDKQTPDRPTWHLQQKLWKPHWIGHTALGKTFYATDYWIGKLAWQSKVFSAEAADERNKPLAEFLLSQFAVCGGRDDGLRDRVMLRPATINWTWSPERNGDLSCQIHRIGMRIDGANTTVEADGSEKLSLNLNDSRFAAGRIANLFTEHYDSIATLWPMFERLRQLNGLVSAAAELRGRKFQPNADLRTRINTTFHHYTTKSALPLGERLVL